jgi:hypothetical protein
MGLVSSNGFERNKATLLGKLSVACRGYFPGFFWDPSFPGSGVYRFQEGSEKTVSSFQLPVVSDVELITDN